MKAVREQHTKPVAAYTKGIVLVLFGLVGIGVVLFLVQSGVIPTLYIAITAVLWFLAALLASWLLIKGFQRAEGTARVLGSLIIIGVVAAAGLGLFVFQSALGTLSAISKDGTVSIDTNKPFYVFISGIDTYGDIETQSRSDVNILAGVNPQTHTITLVTVPRDAYLPIALGGNDQGDKLTHAGNYGVESSMKTVANLFDVDVNAYVRINFTSFIQGVDKLGGITIHNPTAFTASGERFPAGDIYLNGEQALIFSRERMSLAGGDLDRGKNQQRVISGIVAKASSVRSLDGLYGLLEIGRESVQTNATNDAIKQLINQQVKNPVQWETNTLELTGHGETGTRPSYAMPNAKLYMYILDDASVEKVKSQLAEAMSTR